MVVLLGSIPSSALRASASPRSRFENARYGSGLALPFLGFRGQSFAAGRGQLVILCAAIVFRGAPLGLYAARALHPAERRKQRSGIDAKDAIADLLNAQRNAPAVHGLENQSLQDQHLKRSLHQVARPGFALCCSVCPGGHRSLLLTVKRIRSFPLIVKRKRETP